MDPTVGLPADTTLSIFIHSGFDTGVYIDTPKLSFEQYAAHSTRTVKELYKLVPAITWIQEEPNAIRGSDDPQDFLPIINLSFVTAIDPSLLENRQLQLSTPSGAKCTIRTCRKTGIKRPEKNTGAGKAKRRTMRRIMAITTQASLLAQFLS